MAKVLVTGATGMAGFNIVHALLRQGRKVRCLVRSLKKGTRLLPRECELIPGDMNDQVSLMEAVKDCPIIYHAAGIPEQWMRNPRRFEEVNTRGTQNLIEASLSAGCQRFMYFSTVDIFDVASGAGFNETAPLKKNAETFYGRSKLKADQMVCESISRKLPAVFLHPAAIYGAGPSDSPGLNRFLGLIMANKVPAVVPGGVPVVFAGDLADAAVRAEQSAEVGERFILSESYVEFHEIARVAKTALGMPAGIRTLPFWLANTAATFEEILGRCFGKMPLLHKGQLHVAQWGARPESEKAKAKLNWHPRSFKEGIIETLAFLGASQRLRNNGCTDGKRMKSQQKAIAEGIRMERCPTASK